MWGPGRTGGWGAVGSPWDTWTHRVPGLESTPLAPPTPLAGLHLVSGRHRRRVMEVRPVCPRAAGLPGRHLCLPSASVRRPVWPSCPGASVASRRSRLPCHGRFSHPGTAHAPVCQNQPEGVSALPRPLLLPAPPRASRPPASATPTLGPCSPRGTSFPTRPPASLLGDVLPRAPWPGAPLRRL